MVNYYVREYPRVYKIQCLIVIVLDVNDQNCSCRGNMFLVGKINLKKEK